MSHRLPSLASLQSRHELMKAKRQKWREEQEMVRANEIEIEPAIGYPAEVSQLSSDISFGHESFHLSDNELSRKRKYDGVDEILNSNQAEWKKVRPMVDFSIHANNPATAPTSHRTDSYGRDNLTMKPEFRPCALPSNMSSSSLSSSAAATTAPSSNASSSATALSSSPSVPLDVAGLLNFRSLRDRHQAEQHLSIDSLLSAPTLRDKIQQRSFQQLWVDKDGRPVGIKEFCPHKLKRECEAARQKQRSERATRLRLHDPSHPSYPRLDPCNFIHVIEALRARTDRRLGDCPFLVQCQKPTCRRVHYEIDPEDKNKLVDKQIQLTSTISAEENSATSAPGRLLSQPSSSTGAMDQPKQWINCDIRTLDVSVLGQFNVIMMDPPWRINMQLPYSTMNDEEMLNLNIGPLQSHGICCVWVVTRAIDLGRRCLARWGYREAGELLWVKVDQLNRLRRAGRTGPFLNHACEHCIIGVKGPLPQYRNIDCDVIIAPARETSWKPDEVYGILERLVPAGAGKNVRRLEIFGRPHNTRNGWLTIGNQLEGVHVEEKELRDRIVNKYGEKAIESGWIGPGEPPSK